MELVSMIGSATAFFCIYFLVGGLLYEISCGLSRNRLKWPYWGIAILWPLALWFMWLEMSHVIPLDVDKEDEHDNVF